MQSSTRDSQEVYLVDPRQLFSSANAPLYQGVESETQAYGYVVTRRVVWHGPMFWSITLATLSTILFALAFVDIRNNDESWSPSPPPPSSQSLQFPPPPPPPPALNEDEDEFASGSEFGSGSGSGVTIAPASGHELGLEHLGGLRKIKKSVGGGSMHTRQGHVPEHPLS